jgi:hypothetical protein
LPDINDVSIQNQDLRANAFQVSNDLLCAAAVGAEMEVREYGNIDIALLHGGKFSKFYQQI